MLASENGVIDVSTLPGELQKLSIGVEAFSLVMRSLFLENRIVGDTEEKQEFLRLRDDTQADAMVYLSSVMPLNEIFITKVQDFFEYYIYLDFEEWIQNFDDIMEDLRTNQSECKTLIIMHTEMMTVLKKRSHSAQSLCCKFTELTEEYDKEISSLRASLMVKYGLVALGLLVDPGWV